MTVLIVGGAYQGKQALAKQLFGLEDTDFACGETCTPTELCMAKALNGLHRYIRRQLHDGECTDGLLEQLTNKIIICDEIGCGVVPFERAQDDWRETTGRLCCDLAARAELVIRVHAGIGQAIKGKLPEHHC